LSLDQQRINHPLLPNEGPKMKVSILKNSSMTPKSQPPISEFLHPKKQNTAKIYPTNKKLPPKSSILMRKKKSKNGIGLLKLEENYTDNDFENKIKQVEVNEKEVPTIDELMM
jgi:hypothetical protein